MTILLTTVISYGSIGRNINRISLAGRLPARVACSGKFDVFCRTLVRSVTRANTASLGGCAPDRKFISSCNLRGSNGSCIMGNFLRVSRTTCSTSALGEVVAISGGISNVCGFSYPLGGLPRLFRVGNIGHVRASRHLGEV